MSEKPKSKLRRTSKINSAETSATNTALPTEPEDVIVFKRGHFYMALVVLAFFAGILVGFIAWGRAPIAGYTTASNSSATQASVQTQPHQFIRYDIPSDGFPGIGPADAPVVIVEFSDFQCPFCKRFHDEAYRQLLVAYPDKIRFVYRHLPLTSIHPEAFPSAEASMCANEQNAFWEYHDKLFENQDKLGRDLHIQIASNLKLDITAFEECLNSHKYKDIVQKDLDFAINLGVTSTPTFFINGLAVVGAQPLDVFSQVIDKELAGEIPK